MKIKGDTLEFILEACRNTHPNEFIGLLRAEDGIITEILVIPGSRFERSRSVMMMHMVPIDRSIVGSVHSHPGAPIPSRADLSFFSKAGRIHLIVGQPYTRGTLRAFGADGQPTELEIVK